MGGPVDICNLALVMIGGDVITSFDPNESARAKTASILYAPTRDAVLRAFEWNFALAQQTLARELTAPLMKWTYRFALPTDPYCLRALRIDAEVDDPDAEWIIQGRKLLTDEDAVILEYIARVEDWTQFDSLFIDCLAAKLAAGFALSITGKASYVQAMEQLYLDRLPVAETINGRERKRVESEPLVDIR